LVCHAPRPRNRGFQACCPPARHPTAMRTGRVGSDAMSDTPVRRDKAALSSGCETHPATAPAGSNRSSYGGDEIAEAFG